jgi:hypothetical protein
LDKFPEAFKRFEEVVDVSKIKSFQQLKLAFSHWAGKKWKETPLQVEALKREAFRLGIAGIEVTLEEYVSERQRIDELYRRVYYSKQRYEYNKLQFEKWEAYLKHVRQQALAEGWTAEVLATMEKPISARLESAKRRMERWQREWQSNYTKLKLERERFRLKTVRRK